MRIHHLNCGSLCPHGAAPDQRRGRAARAGPSRLPLPADRDRRRARPASTPASASRTRATRASSAPSSALMRAAGASSRDGAEAGRGARLRRRRRAPDRHHPPRPRPLRRPARLPRGRGPRLRAASSTRRCTRACATGPATAGAHWKHGPNWVRHDGRRRRVVRLRGRPHPARPRRRGAADPARRPLARPHRRRDQDRRAAGCCTAATPTSTTASSHTPPPARPACASSRTSTTPTAGSASPTRSGCASWPPATAKRSPSSAPTTRTSWSASRRAGAAAAA